MLLIACILYYSLFLEYSRYCFVTVEVDCGEALAESRQRNRVDCNSVIAAACDSAQQRPMEQSNFESFNSWDNLPQGACVQR